MVLSCTDCDRHPGTKEAARFLLECVDADLRPDWQLLTAALQRLHRRHRRLRALTAAQLNMLTSGRLPGEVGAVGRYRKMIARDGDGCVWCGRSMVGAADCTIEHILPLSLGGPDTLANTMCACKDCNNRRQEMRVGTWVATCRFRGQQPRQEALEAVLRGLVADGGSDGLAAQRELTFWLRAWGGCETCEHAHRTPPLALNRRRRC